MPNILPKAEKYNPWMDRSNLYRSSSRDITGTESSNMSIISALDYDEHDEKVFKPLSSNIAAN